PTRPGSAHPPARASTAPPPRRPNGSNATPATPASPPTTNLRRFTDDIDGLPHLDTSHGNPNPPNTTRNARTRTATAPRTCCTPRTSPASRHTSPDCADERGIGHAGASAKQPMMLSSAFTPAPTAAAANVPPQRPDTGAGCH